MPVHNFSPSEEGRAGSENKLLIRATGFMRIARPIDDFRLLGPEAYQQPRIDRRKADGENAAGRLSRRARKKLRQTSSREDGLGPWCLNPFRELANVRLRGTYAMYDQFVATQHGNAVGVHHVRDFVRMIR